MMKFTVFLMAVAACISSSVALECYNCDSLVNANCRDTNSSTAETITCKSHYTDKIVGATSVCYKIVVDDEGKKEVIRTCGRKVRGKSFCLVYDDFEHCSVCDKDLCNGSSPVELTNIWMTLIPTIITVALIKFSF